MLGSCLRPNILRILYLTTRVASKQVPQNVSKQGMKKLPFNLSLVFQPEARPAPRLVGRAPAPFAAEGESKDHRLNVAQVGFLNFSNAVTFTSGEWKRGVRNFFDSKYSKLPAVAFFSTSFPLASTRWVQSTFSSHYPLSSKQIHQLTSATVTIFPSEFFLGNAGTQTRAAWFAIKLCYHCAMAAPLPTDLLLQS